MLYVWNHEVWYHLHFTERFLVIHFLPPALDHVYLFALQSLYLVSQMLHIVSAAVFPVWPQDYVAPAGSSDMQLQLIDLTEVDAPQHHQQMPSKPALEQESLTAAQLPSEQSQADSTPRNALAPSKATASPARRSSLGNPMSPTTSSGRKHKQADIRGFLSPKSVCK